MNLVRLSSTIVLPGMLLRIQYAVAQWKSRSARSFSSVFFIIVKMSANVECDTLDLPVIDLEPFLRRNEGESFKDAMLVEAKKAADALHKYGVLCVRDPRATEAQNDTFLDMLEQYFEQPEETKLGDVRKELSYQVGATPSRTELPRDHCERMKVRVSTFFLRI